MAKQFFEATSCGWLVWNPITRKSVGLTAEYARVFARAVLGVEEEQEPLAHEAQAAMDAG